jgi:hypothetical protein
MYTLRILGLLVGPIIKRELEAFTHRSVQPEQIIGLPTNEEHISKGMWTDSTI